MYVHHVCIGEKNNIKIEITSNTKERHKNDAFQNNESFSRPFDISVL